MILENISASLQKGKATEVKDFVQEALNQKIAPQTILNEGLIKGMTIIGGKFKRNEVFVPEVLVAARAMNAGLTILRPILVASGTHAIGKALVCTVQGDLHDIGKNLVKMMIEGQGIECTDLGVDCSPEKIVESVILYEPDIVCLSALLTTTMMKQKLVIDELKKANVMKNIRVIIGGAPVTQDFADGIGADGYAPDAASAADLAVKLIMEKRNLMKNVK
ncbi:MAG: corrinoid protein [Tenericutes bacterium]|nr:corrinoid protein [Mycoplasmatota bacterium]